MSTRWVSRSGGVALLAVAVAAAGGCGGATSPGGSASPGGPTLSGTSWVLTGYSGMQSTADTGRVTAVFGADGTLSGNGGCNSYSATWAATGDARLTLGPISATAMACGASATEGQYFTALGAVTSYRIEGDRLTLRDATGAAQVTYARARG